MTNDGEIHLREGNTLLCGTPLNVPSKVAWENPHIDVGLWRWHREKAINLLIRDHGRDVEVCRACIREDRKRQLPVSYT